MSATALIEAARRLSSKVDAMRFAPPVAFVYNPLEYAFAPHELYLRRYGDGRRRVVFVGMNPGPFGMMQTGVPFGEIAMVRDWMGIDAPVRQPAAMHPKRPIEGFACTRSEVSGKRLWGWAAQRFGSAQAFFSECFVLNYCPLVFLETSGRNLTPDKLPRAELAPLQQACDEHLRSALAELSPDWAIGIGAYARQRIAAALGRRPDDGALPRIATVLHPSPASPIANRGWAEAAEHQLAELGVFEAT
ncbi:MAG: single-stranded DNA-binding protein [Burkholderiaceae bacterium]|jgi:single-strand selective monofunctional uracil DNA glycosylase|nr:single-stranded DNA-binding protein [Burkholderiaceae bacterium]